MPDQTPDTKTTYSYEERQKIDADVKLLEAKANAEKAEAAKEAAKVAVLKELAAIPTEIRDNIEGYHLPSEHPVSNESQIEWNRKFFECIGAVFGRAAVIHLIWAIAVCFVVYTYCVLWVPR